MLDEPIISPYEEERREFVQQVFWNVMDVYKVNSALLQALLRRQAAGPTVFQVGDVMLKYVEKFEPFVRYGAHQVIGKYVFESEKSSNPEFTMFVQVCVTFISLQCVILIYICASFTENRTPQAF